MQANHLKILSLNIEHDCHFDRIIPFINHVQADVVLLQEVLDKDIAYIEEKTAMKGPFVALNIVTRDTARAQLGLLTLTKLPMLKNYSRYYKGNDIELPILTAGERGSAVRMNRAILVTELLKGNQTFRLINTHFTWSNDGKPTELQHENLKVLMSYLAEIPEFVMCGDFNAPRGTAIFEAIAKKYKDNIPAHIITTIDEKLHKTGDLKLVVDGIFSTPGFCVDSVEVVDNLSDHCGLLATVKLSNK